MMKPMKRALIFGICGLLAWTVSPAPTYAAGPTIGDTHVVDPTVKRYDPFVLTFGVTSTATNPYFPYDPDPPPGVPAGVGVSVDGLFSPDNWATVYTQPAFLYQPYTYTARDGADHLYPAGDPVWMILAIESIFDLRPHVFTTNLPI